jgi:hypothetical protein
VFRDPAQWWDGLGVCDGGGGLHDGIDRVQICVAFGRDRSGDGAGLQSCVGGMILADDRGSIKY